MTDVHSLSGAFALDALDEPERASFSRHMESCESCSQEVAELRETVARLVDDVSSVPPPRIREAVLARVAITRQEPPSRGTARSRAPRPHRQSWRHRTTMAIVAASMAGLAALSGVFYVQAQRADDERARIEAVLSAPDASLRIAQLTGGGHMTVVMSPSRAEAVVTLAQAQKYDKDHAYQLWKIRGGKPTSGGVMPAGKGDAVMVMTGLRDTETIAVTVEPAGGSQQPSTPIVGQVPLAT